MNAGRIFYISDRLLARRGHFVCLLYAEHVKKKLANHEISKTNMALSYVLFISW